ncbi:TonB-dependent receptor [Pseudovibrio sp. Tun.PSC04-5.I4]|uniref:TonB-dependent receptor plug domain-containing protein n=1 Tax=Pseudovibrio sp. Tun.PSC04-5.I4 TaxID=1798213 RepID=UPI0008848306|nr:TonB-dependent receptor [Pseudovibrio sp. Tun.PSC04-5.I4]SDQ96244.1 vitamin B12 transporter [Pseudovibrio sp. Tun.PSC04-5.I4]
MRLQTQYSAALKSSAAFIALLSTIATGKAEEVLLDDVIVTANRYETEAGKTGSTTIVVTEEELEEDGSVFVQEYLAKLPGLSFTQNGGAGKKSTITLRGMSSRYIKVLVDGIDISDPSGPQVSTRLEHLLLADVERIEVLKGSQSALYGGQAVAGVINIMTKRAPAGTVKQNAQVEAGAYKTFKAFYGLQAATDRSDIAISAEHFRTEGFSAQTPKGGPADMDGYENTTLSARGSFDATDNLNIYFSVRGAKGISEIDGYNDPDRHDEMLYRQISGKLGANILWLSDQVTSDVSVETTDIKREQDYAKAGKANSVFEGARLKFALQNDLEVSDRVTFNLGADWMRETARGQDEARLAGGFVQALIEPVDGLNLAASARVDNHSEFGNYWSGRLTASYQILENTRLHSSFGNGFRAPSLYELYNPEYGNESLEPETSLSFDLGIELGWFGDKIKTSATYFDILTNNLIVYHDFGTVSDPYKGEYRQITGTSRSQGIELGASYAPVENLRLSSAYTYTWATEDGGKRRDRVPLHDLNVAVSYDPTEDITLNVNGNFIAGLTDKGKDMKDTFLLGAKASYDVTEEVEVYVRGENLLNQRYERIKGYQTSGLAVYAGLRASF